MKMVGLENLAVRQRIDERMSAHLHRWFAHEREVIVSAVRPSVEFGSAVPPPPPQFAEIRHGRDARDHQRRRAVREMS